MVIPFDWAIDERLCPPCSAVRRSLESMPRAFAAPSITGLLRGAADWYEVKLTAAVEAAFNCT
jgi:hypothetical protein